MPPYARGGEELVIESVDPSLLEQRTSTPLKCSGAEAPSHIESPVSFEGQVLDHFHHEAHSDQIGIDDASFQQRQARIVFIICI